MCGVSLIDGHIDEPTMTDEDIVKAFELCINFDLDNCPTCCYFDSSEENEWCSEKLFASVLDLINRKDTKIAELTEEIKSQKAEIERLREGNKEQKAIIEAIEDSLYPLPFETDFSEAIKKAKSEAIKEFAERLKNQAYINNYCDLVINTESIDNLVKEMVGE